MKYLAKFLAILIVIWVIFSIAWIGLAPGIVTEIGHILRVRQNNPGIGSTQTAVNEVKSFPRAMNKPEPTSTPEIFNPLWPSPTASKNDLPRTCQATDLNVYINQEWGYCFAFPFGYDLDDTQGVNGMVSLYGKPLDVSLEPVRVSLDVSAAFIPARSQLSALVDAYLSSAAFQNLPSGIHRQSASLDEEPAEVLEPMPGRLNFRQIMVLHHDRLYTLQFGPLDVALASPDLEALYQTVSGSFAFMPVTQTPEMRRLTASWFEFGENIRFTYDSSLSPWVEAATVPAVPPSENILFVETHPAYVQFRFLGYQSGRLYDLPLLPFDNRLAQVMIFQTADFSGYGEEQTFGFPSQLQALQAYLQAPDFNRCGLLFSDNEPPLPMVPWLYARQAFCSKPDILEFGGGKGVRYLTFYSQDPSPVLDRQVFYTYQGITEDAQFYIAAFFPVATGVFPIDPPDCPQCGEPNYNPFVEWEKVTSQQLIQLNSLKSEDFSPNLAVLDEMIHSIQISD